MAAVVSKSQFNLPTSTNDPGARFAVKGVERLHHHALAYGLDHSGNAVGRAPVKDGHMVDGQLLHTLGDLSDSIALRRDHKEQVAIVETV